MSQLYLLHMQKKKGEIWRVMEETFLRQPPKNGPHIFRLRDWWVGCLWRKIWWLKSKGSSIATKGCYPSDAIHHQDQHIFRNPELELYFLPNCLGIWNTPSSKIDPKSQPGFRELVQYFLEPITSRSCIDLVKWMRWTWYISKWVCVLLKP